MKNNGTILIVDDELSMREFLAILLEKAGYTTLAAANGKAALQIIENKKLDLVISDIRMPTMNGLDLLAAAKKIDSNLPVVMITAYASPEDAVTAMKNGAYDYITKPFKLDEIRNVIVGAISRAQPTGSGGENSETARRQNFSNRGRRHALAYPRHHAADNKNIFRIYFWH